MTDTLQFHALEFDDGVVTESGFRALLDAEVYGAASSIGEACVLLPPMRDSKIGANSIYLCRIRHF
jgi:hypothetical protein